MDAGNEGFGPLDHRHCVLLLLCFGYLTFRLPNYLIRYPEQMATPDRLRRPEANTRHLLGRATDRLERSIAAAVAAAGHPVRPAHAAVFTNIDSEGTRLTQLAERALMTPQAMAELVDDLARLGYVTREPDPTDGRAKLIVLTDRGFDAVQDAFDTITEPGGAARGGARSPHPRAAPQHAAAGGGAPEA